MVNLPLLQIGQTARPHGVKGELAIRIDDVYFDDLTNSPVVLIGDPAVPYTLERTTGGGKPRIKLEDFHNREQVALLANKPLWLPESAVTVEEDAEITPYDRLIDMYIVADDYPRLGPIEDVMDLPEHHLAELTHEGKSIYIPLHDDLIDRINEAEGEVYMTLPPGLLDL